MSVRTPRAVLLATSCLVMLGAGASAKAAEDGSRDNVVGELVVTGAKAAAVDSATGLSMTLRETPQQVTLIQAQQIQDFALTDVNQLLAQVPGVNVERSETDRTEYNARGFDITNLQMDGVGLPLIAGIQFGSFDTAMFDRIEVVRGANALMTGIGNPSATVNYVRKRPTMAFQGNVAVEGGSWGHGRVEADLSGPLDASGTLRGRLVAAGQSQDSYLDYNKNKRGLVYGALAWDATSKLTLTGGYSLNDSRSKGVLWGALPLEYANGAIINYPSSASTSAPWTYWNVVDQTSFLEARYSLPKGWSLKATATYRTFDEHAKLLYAYGNPDPVTGLGVGGMSGIYPSFYHQEFVDLAASGPFDLFGRTHQLAVGFSGSRNQGHEYENFSSDPIDFPSVFQWGQVVVPEPTYPGAYLATDITDNLYRGFVSTHLNLTDRLKAVLGATAVSLSSKGYSYGVDQARSESKVSPYAGVTFDLTPQILGYASYTDIFNPQIQSDINHRRLDAAHGESVEAGLKGEFFDKRLYLTGAVFQAQQLGLADQAGIDVNGDAYYVGKDTKVSGLELETAGKITDRWTVNGGFTVLKMTDPSGAQSRTYIPRSTLKLATTYTFPTLRNLKLGAAVRWQGDTYIQDLVRVDQKAYVITDLSASIDLTRKVRATLNVKNAGDDKHYSSLAWGQAFYGEPRNLSLRLDYAF